MIMLINATMVKAPLNYLLGEKQKHLLILVTDASVELSLTLSIATFFHVKITWITSSQ